jgi:putative membrane protein
MRALAFAAGACALASVWSGVVPALLPGPFAGHMTMHMVVVAVAAPLLALALAGGRFDPARAWPRLFAPIPASVIELVAVWAWHAPALHHFARASRAALALEQATFLASGLLLWIAALGGERQLRAERAGQGGIALLLTSMHMTLLGALLALPPRALYRHGHHAHDGHAGGLAQLADQHLGGAIMLLVGGVVYLAGGLALAALLLRQRSRVDAPEGAR